VWEEEPTSFFHATIRELLKKGFTEEDIIKICGGNFVRNFSETTK